MIEVSTILDSYKKILDIVPVSCMIHGADFRFVYWNPASEKIFGFRSDEAIGKFPHELIAIPELKDFLMKKFQEMKDGKQNANNPAENITKNGKRVICEWHNTRLTDPAGNFIGILSVCLEITDRVLAEREMMKFASLIESSSEFIAISSIKGKVSYINKAGYKMLGLEKNSIRIFSICDFFDQSGTDRMLNEILPALTKDGNWEGEFSFLNKTINKTVPVYFIGFVIRDPKNHEPVSLAIISHNITHQKESEYKLIRSERQLQSALQELNTFIYRASHDLKGPLSSIVGLTNLAQKEISDTQSLKYIGMIQESTSKLSGILLGLLETMRVRESKPVPERIDLDEMIGEIFGRYKFVPDIERIKIVKKVTNKEPFYSFKGILDSILQNLVENSIHYHAYDREGQFISVVTSDLENGVKIIVDDNGTGMTEEIKTNIFEMYYRGSLDSKGSGLGLYIVKTAIDRLNGTISVHTEPGKGTSFELFIPSVRSGN